MEVLCPGLRLKMALLALRHIKLEKVILFSSRNVLRFLQNYVLVATEDEVNKLFFYGIQKVIE